MAATGKTPILLYGSTTATNVPVAGNLTNSSDGCEIAINVADKNLFFKDSTNVVNTVPIRQSSGSSNGWLSSTDWTTFNSKQAALVSGTNIKTVSGTTLLGSGDLGTIGTGYGGTGTSTTFTAGSVVFAGTSGIYSQDNSNLFWNDADNKLGIGSVTPATSLYVNNGQVANTSSGNFVTTKYNSQGVAWSANTSLPSYILNGDASWRPEISWYRGSRTYPEFSIRQHTTNDTGGEIYAGPGTVAPTKLAEIKSTGWTFVGDTTLSTGNLVIGTSGKGIDFSATAGTGTSELLADYEEGTWTPTQGAGLTVVGSFSSSGTYTKVGRQVTVIGNIAGSTSVATSSGGVMVNGLPYTPATYCEGTAANVAGTLGSILFINSSTSIYSVSVIAATTNIRFAATYFV